ncbi:MAG: hypothetical protein C0621_03635 [Desulfuromonas sp.]|nr:MAG: hypothetical protein C0621_03635 [Desulfuromonas sp.]
MKIWQQISICIAAALLASLPGQVALAASVTGRLSTEVEWYDDAQGDSALPVYQYLQLNANDLAAKGIDFKGYGRISDDINNEIEAESRLYYAYFEKNDLFQDLDLKLGRQFVSTTAGASLMDGLSLDYGKSDAFTLSLFGGGDVAYYSGYSADDLILGSEIGSRLFDRIDLSLSYVQKWDDGDLAKELFGLELDYDVNKRLNLYSETQFDYLSESVSYFLGGASYQASEALNLRTEYLYSLPVFSATSIYSVFAVSEYEEVMAELNYRLGVGLYAFGRVSREIYPEFADATLVEAGLEKVRTDKCSGYLSGVFREDRDGQDLKGLKVHGAYLFTPQIQAGVGAEVNVLQRRLEDDSDETTSCRYWADVTGYITEALNVQAKIERVNSDLWDVYNRGRVRLNFLF